MRILIADDDPVALILLEHALTDWGYEVEAVRDGAAAWESLRKVDAPPLAILDWMMPGFDGPDVCRKVRRESEAPFAYLVLLTSRAAKQDVVQGMESGADDYVSKPLDQDELKVRIRAGERIVELHRALLDQATRDSLTTLWNRKAILDILHRELARTQRDSGSVGVVMADIDHFKRINDTLGHLAGDFVIREVAHRLSTTLRPSDSVGRYGGEEFLAILPGCDLPGALAAAERMRLAVAESDVVTPSANSQVTLSLGVAVSGDPDVDPLGLIKLADDALYRAKCGGRNRVEAASCASQSSDKTMNFVAPIIVELVHSPSM